MIDAVEFLTAAELLLNHRTGISLPAYFLFGRAIELTLKAFLLHNGLSISRLASRREFGHSLEKLWAEAVKYGLDQQTQFGAPEEGVIELLSKEYFDMKLTYRVTGGTYCLPDIAGTEDVARRLVRAIELVVAPVKP